MGQKEEFFAPAHCACLQIKLFREIKPQVFSSYHRNLIKTFHNKANNSTYHENCIVFFWRFLVSGDRLRRITFCRHYVMLLACHKKSYLTKSRS